MASRSKKRPAMGKGLEALLESSKTDITSTRASKSSALGSVAMLSISSIKANPFNPRTEFEDNALQELSHSISKHGIIQPLTVRKLGRDKYQLISGERRYRAAQLSKLEEVPAYIRVANDQTMLEMALVENIQRQDLNAIEIALSYQRLIEECDLTQEKLAKQISKSRTSITNHLRLLNLPPLIQLGVRDKRISMGHARALVGLKEDEDKQVQIYNKIVEEELSVREVEELLRSSKKKKTETKKANKPTLSEHQEGFTKFLSEKISSKVKIKKQPSGKGKLVINFESEVDLNRIIEIMNEK